MTRYYTGAISFNIIFVFPTGISPFVCQRSRVSSHLQYDKRLRSITTVPTVDLETGKNENSKTRFVSVHVFDSKLLSLVYALFWEPQSQFGFFFFFLFFLSFDLENVRSFVCFYFLFSFSLWTGRVVHIPYK